MIVKFYFYTQWKIIHINFIIFSNMKSSNIFFVILKFDTFDAFMNVLYAF